MSPKPNDRKICIIYIGNTTSLFDYYNHINVKTSNDAVIFLWCRPFFNIFMFVDRPSKKMHAHPRSFYYYIGIFVKNLSCFYQSKYQPLLTIFNDLPKAVICFRSNTFLTVTAKSLIARGFNAKVLIPSSVAFSSVIFSLYPVQRIIGMSWRMYRSSFISLLPVISGIVMSVITRSN